MQRTQQAEAIRKELLELEQRYWNAVKNNDPETAMALSDDPCLVVGAQGVREVNRSAFAKIMNGTTYKVGAFSIEDVHVRKISSDVFAMAYKVREDLVVNGQTIELEAFDSSVWIKRDGKWVCIVHTESLAGDPLKSH